MKYATTYTLTAYDADTGEELFCWPNVVVDDKRQRPVTNSVITDPSERQFVVIGIHYDSTATDWRIDVRAIE